MKKLLYYPIFHFLLIVIATTNLGATGVKEIVNPGVFHSDFPGAWSYVGSTGEYLVTSGMDQQVSSPYESRWQGSLGISGAVTASFEAYITEGLGTAGMGALILRNSPLYSGGYPDYTLSLYDSETLNESSLDVMTDQNIYLSFKGFVPFDFSGTRISIPKTEMYSQSVGDVRSVFVEGELTAPKVFLTEAKEVSIPAPGAGYSGPDVIDSLFIGKDGTCSGLVFIEDRIQDFKGNIGVRGNRVSVNLLSDSEKITYDYTYEFISEDEFRLIFIFPVEDKMSFEAFFGFAPGSLGKGRYRQIRTYRREK